MVTEVLSHRNPKKKLNKLNVKWHLVKTNNLMNPFTTRMISNIPPEHLKSVGH